MSASDHTVHAELQAAATRLHDRVIPAATAAGLRVDLARTLLAGTAPDIEIHLEHAATALAALSVELRAELDRLHGS